MEFTAENIAILIAVAVVAAALPPLIAMVRRAKHATAIAVMAVACVAAMVFTASSPIGGLIALAWLVTLFWSILDTRTPKAPKTVQAKPLYSK